MIMKIKFSFWEIVFYLSLLILFIWVILKSAGTIRTPLWLEFGVPALSTIFIILAFFKELMDSIKQIAVGLATLNVKFEHMEKDLGILKSDVKFLKRKVI